MQFRRTSAKDIDSIMSILADGRSALAALGIDQWQGGYPRRDVIEADVERGDSFIVEDGERIIATAMIGFAGERDYDRIDHGSWLTPGTSKRPCYGVVHRVAVRSTDKGKGAAAYLLSRAEELARAEGSASVRIDTHPGNVPMRRLLQKCGYAQCGTIYIAHAEEGTPERIAYEKLVAPGA